MQVVLDIPESFAASLSARGLSLQSYLDEAIRLSATAPDPAAMPPDAGSQDLSVFVARMKQIFKDAPDLPGEAFDRESFYQDHD